jgi:hypothetical protein
MHQAHRGGHPLPARDGCAAVSLQLSEWPVGEAQAQCGSVMFVNHTQLIRPLAATQPATQHRACQSRAAVFQFLLSAVQCRPVDFNDAHPQHQSRTPNPCHAVCSAEVTRCNAVKCRAKQWFCGLREACTVIVLLANSKASVALAHSSTTHSSTYHSAEQSSTRREFPCARQSSAHGAAAIPSTTTHSKVPANMTIRLCRDCAPYVHELPLVGLVADVPQRQRCPPNGVGAAHQVGRALQQVHLQQLLRVEM